jgi:glycosyltransferase involved in cell wall biosynthesis
MRLLLITNLYPPQELGGYGRCMADFAWGLLQRGHWLQVLCSDASYLGCAGAGPSGEPVDRRLQLKGSFNQGVQVLHDGAARAAVDAANAQVLQRWLAAGPWDGVLLGNLDLLGPELLQPLLASGLRLLHHVGFVTPPFAREQFPGSAQYRLLAASGAVRQALVQAGLPAADAPVVYPGARVDLFGPPRVTRPLPSPGGPLRVCFAGLQMVSKGPHTLLEALVLLRERGVMAQAMLAGGSFQVDYASQLRRYCDAHGLGEQVWFAPQLTRDQLARFFRLNQVCVFPSLHPEAFGIVAAEAMASGLALISTGVGGAAELFDDGISGLAYPAGDAAALAERLARLAADPALLTRLQHNGQQRVRERFSVATAAQQLEALLH